MATKEELMTQIGEQYQEEGQRFHSWMQLAGLSGLGDNFETCLLAVAIGHLVTGEEPEEVLNRLRVMMADFRTLDDLSKMPEGSEVGTA